MITPAAEIQKLRHCSLTLEFLSMQGTAALALRSLHWSVIPFLATAAWVFYRYVNCDLTYHFRFSLRYLESIIKLITM
jgi:hypothetical protein